MPTERPICLAVVILAAGASTRMGKPKLLLPWGDTSVLGRLFATWRQLGAEQISIVKRTIDGPLDAEIIRLGFPGGNRIANPKPEVGMFGSVQIAAQWLGWTPGLTHWAIVLGDQPHLQQDTLATLLDFVAQHPRQICQPARQGRPRHPVILPKAVFKSLAQSTHDHLKQFLQARSDEIRLVEIDDPGLDLDMDTPEEYERAKRLFFGR